MHRRSNAGGVSPRAARAATGNYEFPTPKLQIFEKGHLEIIDVTLFLAFGNWKVGVGRFLAAEPG
jgi:hypothetical protein